MKTTKVNKSVTLDEVKKVLREKISLEFKMSVYEWARSVHPRELGITVKPETIEQALSLSPGASQNYKLYAVLFKHFEIGDLSKKIETVKKVKFFVAKN